MFLFELEKVLLARRQADEKTSYVSRMYARGLDEILRKLSEETTETILASRDFQASDEAESHLVHEAADLLFHLLLLLTYQGVPLSQVLKELERRQGRSGLEEKASRQKSE